MSEPDFLICGTQKGGTGSLYRYLEVHPEIYIPDRKEIHFFDKNFHKGIEWYEQHFNIENKSIKVCGEATPDYMYVKNAPKLIYKYYPNVKLIFILRNPVERAYSHYWHNVKNGIEDLSFENAIEIEDKRLRTSIQNKIYFSYKDRGKYIDQIKRFENYFPRKQMLILFSEDLELKPDIIMKKVFNFLEVDDQFSHFRFKKRFHSGGIPRSYKLQKIKSKIRNKYIQFIIDEINLKNYPSMDPNVKEKLVDHFRPYNKELEIYLDKDTGWT